MKYGFDSFSGRKIVLDGEDYVVLRGSHPSWASQFLISRVCDGEPKWVYADEAINLAIRSAAKSVVTVGNKL